VNRVDQETEKKAKAHKGCRAIQEEEEEEEEEEEVCLVGSKAVFGLNEIIRNFNLKSNFDRK
jgi:hypothetical protein